MADFSNIENQIDSAITTNGVGAITGAILNAILKGMLSAVDTAKEDTLTFDLTPTEDSAKPVTSGGVYDALAAAAQDVATTLADYYTKTEADTLLAAKADDADVMHLTGAETVRGVKDFRDGILVQQGIGCNGNITMNSHTISGLATPTTDAEAATKKYVDDADALKADDADVVHLTGDETIAGVKTFSGTLAVTGSAGFTNGATVEGGLNVNDGLYMNGYKIDGVGTPTADTDAATKKYVDDGLAAKQDTISDLATIRSGAAAGATAVQPADLPTISTDILTDYTDDTKTASPKAVFEFGAPEIETALGNNNTIAPNVMYQLGTLSGTVTFVIAVNLKYNGRVQHYYWTFDTGATAPMVNWPAAITGWVGGSAPTISANKHYEISVIDGIAAYFEV